MRRWAIVNTLLGIIVALVGFEIVRTWARGLPAAAPGESASAAPPPAPEPHEKGKRGRGDKAGTLAQQTPAMLVSAIAEKDLFDPSRRPPSVEETTAAVVPVTKPPDNVSVVGVRILGKDREAFVSDGTQGQPVTRRLRTGDQIAGFTVKAIERTALTLTSPSGDVVSMPLTLDKGKSPPTAPRPAIPVRQPQPAAAQGGSPAAGVQGPSPAAGVGGRAAVPITPQPAVAAPGVVPKPGVSTPLPPQVQQKLDQLKQNDKRHRH